MKWRERVRQRVPAHIREPVQAFARFVWERYLEDRCFETAGVLAYASIFALVPLSAAVFGIFAAFPLFDSMSERLTSFLFNNFVPTAAESVATYLRQFADSASGLSSIGALALLGSALLMMKSIEDIFNRIWRVGAPRPGLSRFLVYWTALTLGPLLTVASLALSSYVLSLPLLSSDDSGPMPGLLQLAPMLVELSAFTLAYWIVPNRRVQFRHAVTGGLLAMLLFESAKWGFGFYLRQVPSYQQIYGTVAVLPIFLIWVYLSWVVILLGASIAASLSSFRFQSKAQRLPVEQELFGLLRLIGRLHAAQREGKAVDAEILRKIEPSLSDDLLMRLLDRLQLTCIVQRNEVGDWLLARDLDELTLGEVYEASGLHIPTEEVPEQHARDALGRQVAAIMRDLREPLEAPFDRPLSQLLRAPTKPFSEEE